MWGKSNYETKDKNVGRGLYDLGPTRGRIFMPHVVTIGKPWMDLTVRRVMTSARRRHLDRTTVSDGSQDMFTINSIGGLTQDFTKNIYRNTRKKKQKTNPTESWPKYK